MNGALIAGAARASDSHQCSARHRRIDEKQGHETGQRRESSRGGMIRLFQAARPGIVRRLLYAILLAT